MPPGQDSFRDAITNFRNGAIHMYVGACIKARQQLMLDGNFGVQSGWSDPTQKFVITWLGAIDALRRKITHNPDGTALKDLIDKAKELGVDLVAQSANSPTAPAGDEVARPSGQARDLPYALDGTDPDIPLLSTLNLRNTTARQLIGMLDAHIVQATRLDSRFDSYRITPYESLMLFGGLAEMVDLVVTFGGDANRLAVANGVLPSEEPRGPAAAANLETSAPK
jgi:hypothetical protein